jgi:hypothetical protein
MRRETNGFILLVLAIEFAEMERECTQHIMMKIRITVLVHTNAFGAVSRELLREILAAF